jgi:AraC-like DNA-binding protein
MQPLEVDPAMRAQHGKLSRSPDAGWWARERFELVLLAAEGWSAPRIAQHLGCSAKTLRRVLTAFRKQDMDALERKLRGPSPDFARQRHVHAALASLLEQQRSYLQQHPPHPVRKGQRPLPVGHVWQHSLRSSS